MYSRQWNDKKYEFPAAEPKDNILWGEGINSKFLLTFTILFDLVGNKLYEEFELENSKCAAIEPTVGLVSNYFTGKKIHF